MGQTSRGEFSEIPILDVSGLYGPRSDVEAAREASKRFFALPEEQKLALRINRNFRGYRPFAGSTIVTSSVATDRKPN